MKPKKIRKLKRYDLGGNLGTTGISNDNVNKPHIYLDSAGRTLAGIAQGLGDAIGLGSIVQAGNDAMGVTDQLNRSKEYKTAAGITSGVAGMGMGVANMFGGMGKKGQTSGIESPSTVVSDTGYVTPEITPDNNSVLVSGLQNQGVDVWNAMGGRLYPNGGTLPSYDELNAWNEYLKGLNADLISKGYQPSYLDDKANFGYAENYYNTFAGTNPSLKNVKYNDFVKKMQTYGNDVYMSNNNATKNKQMFQQNTQGNTSNTATNPWGRSNPDGIVGSYTLQQYIPTYNVNHQGDATGDVKAMYNPYDQTNPYSIVSNTMQNNGQPITNQQLRDHWSGKAPLQFSRTVTPQQQQVVQNNQSDFTGYSDDYLKNSTIPTVKNTIAPVVNKTTPNVNQTDINPINQVTTNSGSTNLDENAVDVQALWQVQDGKLVNSNAQKMYGKDQSYMINPEVKTKTFQGDGTSITVGDKRYRIEGDQVYLIQASGGTMNMQPNQQQMLTEFNSGGTHEQNPLGGIPVGNGNLVEQNETKFSPLDKSQPEFVFSEREKDKKTGRSFASLSKSIKNKYKMRPHDTMSKESMDKELNTLAQKQESQKQEKAMKLMGKAMELSPEMFQQANQQSPTPQDMQQPMIMAKGGYTDPPFNLGALFNPMASWANNNQNVINNSILKNQIQPAPTQQEFVTPEVQGVDINSLNTNTTNTIAGDNTGFNTDPNLNPKSNDTGDNWNPVKLFETDAPKDFTGVKAGMFGLQALGESLRLGMTPNTKLAGNLQLDRINPYLQQLIAEQQANQQRANYQNALRNSGLNQSQYLAALTTGLGDMNIGNTIAGINAQNQATNSGIQSQEAQINKNLELQRNDTIAQDTANKSNQLGAVGAGLAQNIGTMMTDKQKREMDMFSLPFVATKENYQLKYNPETGKYEYSYVPYTKTNAMGGKLKNLKKYGSKR